MTDEKGTVEPKPAGSNSDSSAPKITRRRFTKAGAMAPVIMTLGSRPVWGQTCSFSGALSGNDYTTAKPIGGSAHTPSWWLGSNGQAVWPIPGSQHHNDKPLQVVGTTFGCVRSYFVNSDTFFNILELGCSSPKANVAAAILDILANYYYYDMADLNAFLCSTSDSDALKILQCLNGCAA